MLTLPVRATAALAVTGPGRFAGASKRRLRALLADATNVPHAARLRRLARHHAPEYRDYLRVQLERTLSKKANDPGAGARALIERAVGAGASGHCVGCRNGIELDLFRSKGAAEVVGIDLFSERRDIRVMDMHALGFESDRFGIVYCSHSLEHSYELDVVVRELVRVARDGAVIAVEVPLRHKGSDADLFEFASLGQLRRVFAPLIRSTVWQDEQPARSPTNDQGSAVGRIVFTLDKRVDLQRAA
jgi:SAM-dependent methyltransferase